MKGKTIKVIHRWVAFVLGLFNQRSTFLINSRLDNKAYSRYM